MSTYWYLECTDHNPPIRSEMEVEQHTHGLPAIRQIIARREHLIDASSMSVFIGSSEYFTRNTSIFLMQHPTCTLRFVNEYGDVEAVDIPEQPQPGHGRHRAANVGSMGADISWRLSNRFPGIMGTGIRGGTHEIR